MLVQKQGSFLFKNEDPRENVIVYPNLDKYLRNRQLNCYLLFVDTRGLSIKMVILMVWGATFSKILALYMYALLIYENLTFNSMVTS
jgi:hypothetical protein